MHSSPPKFRELQKLIAICLFHILSYLSCFQSGWPVDRIAWFRHRLGSLTDFDNFAWSLNRQLWKGIKDHFQPLLVIFGQFYQICSMFSFLFHVLIFVQYSHFWSWFLVNNTKSLVLTKIIWFHHIHHLGRHHLIFHRMVVVLKAYGPCPGPNLD